MKHVSEENAGFRETYGSRFGSVKNMGKSDDFNTGFKRVSTIEKMYLPGSPLL